MSNQTTISNDWLKTAKCIPCEGGVAPMSEQKAKEDYLPHLKLDWIVVNGTALEHTFEFNSFKEAIAFVNKIANLAEEQNHHPDIQINYNKVTIRLTTHAIGGLSENDFVLAAKAEVLV